MCAKGSPCGCTGSPGSSGGAGMLAVLAVVIVMAAVWLVAWIAAHLWLLLALAAVAVAGTLGAVLWLRRFMVGEGRQLADPAFRRPSRVVVTDRRVRALPTRRPRALQAPGPVLTGRVIPPRERETRGGQW